MRILRKDAFHNPHHLERIHLHRAADEGIDCNVMCYEKNKFACTHQIKECVMEFMDVIRNRRAVREYTDAKIEASVIDRLIYTATLAPSAMNLQPWAFAVTLDREHIERFSKHAMDMLMEDCTNPLEGYVRKHLEENPQFTIFYHAPALVLVIAKTDEAQAKEDCCLAAEVLMLAARNEGLGSCWIGLARTWLDLPSTKRELGIPEHYHVVAPIVLGHPKQWPEPHERLDPQIFRLD
jgi:nitroreductase